MADTIVPVVVVNTVSTSITGVGIVILGVQTGLDYPTLIAGVLGAATALSYLQPASMYKRAFEIITACLFAGYSSPILAHVVSHILVKFDLIKDSVDSPLPLQLALAFLVGYMAHSVILPKLRKIVSTRMRRAAND